MSDLEAGLYRLLRLNPCVAIHELRLRMRGTRAFWVLFVYAAIAAAVFLITLSIVSWESRQFSGAGPNQSNLGRTILIAISYTQLILILLILPAYSAGAISMERERRTLDMLRATLLTGSDVVSGKLLVVLALGLILLLTSLPIASWCLLLGGVAPEEIFYLYTYLLAMGALAATLGMLFSALLSRSVGAVVATYGGLLVLLLLPMVILIILSVTIMQAGPSAVPIGRIWGGVFLALLSLTCAALVFLALRWFWQRLLGPRLRTLSYALPGLLVGAPLIYLLWPGGPALRGAAALSIGWVIVLEPFVTLFGIFEANEVSSTFVTRTPSATGPVNYQVLIWGVCTTAALLGALLCWVLALRAYRVRR